MNLCKHCQCPKNGNPCDCDTMPTSNEKANEPLTSHDLLAVLDDAFGLEQIEARWKPYGYTIETAMRAKAAYEKWAKEDLHLECLDNAILGTNESGGMFPARLEAFFAGWISSANDQVMASAPTKTDEI